MTKLSSCGLLPAGVAGAGDAASEGFEVPLLVGWEAGSCADNAQQRRTTASIDGIAQCVLLFIWASVIWFGLSTEMLLRIGEKIVGICAMAAAMKLGLPRRSTNLLLDDIF